MILQRVLHRFEDTVVKSDHSVMLTPIPVNADKLTWFRFGKLGTKIVMTTDTGAWHTMEPDRFSTLLAGDIDEDGDDYAKLVRKGFIRNGFDAEVQANQIRRTRQLLDTGLNHHRIQLSNDSGPLPMDQAKAIVDHIFTSTPESFTITLVQGPAEPDPSLVAFIHDFAEQKNQYEKRTIQYEFDSTLQGIDEAMRQLLIDKSIQMRARFDGAAALHDTQDAPVDYASALTTIQAIHTAASAAGRTKRDYSVFAEVHVGRHAPDDVDAIVTGLVGAGISDFKITPVLAGDHAIAPADYGRFVRALMTALDAVNREEVVLREVTVDAMLARLRTGDMADRIVMSSAPSTGFNARTYGTDGHIFPSETALQLHENGDPMFLLGNVATASSEDISNHATIRSLMVASMVDCMPGYQHLWSAPYIGIDPVAAYSLTGDIFTKMPTSLHHQATHAMVEAIFLHALETKE